MATWQFDLFLIPEGEPMPSATEDGLDIPGVLAGAALDAQADLVNSFGAPWHMMENWIVFGIENGTRVDFLFDDIGTVGVKVRLDVSAINETILDAICGLARHLDCRYFDAEGRQFIEPRRGAIMQAVGSFRAVKFVKNPRDVIANVPTVQ